MIKCIAFDLDGTLGNTLPMCIEIFREAISPFAKHRLSDQEIINTFGLNEIGMIKKIISDHIDEASENFYQIYEAKHDLCPAPFPQILPLLQKLATKNIILALVTGKSAKSCQITLKKFGLINFFKEIKTGSETSLCKPQCLQEIMQKYQLKPEEIIYIGDTRGDFLDCQSIGIECLSAAWKDDAEIDNLIEINPQTFSTIKELQENLLKRF